MQLNPDENLRITKLRASRECVSDVPTYSARVQTPKGMAFESFASVGSHSINGETRRLLIYLN